MMQVISGLIGIAIGLAILFITTIWIVFRLSKVRYERDLNRMKRSLKRQKEFDNLIDNMYRTMK